MGNGAKAQQKRERNADKNAAKGLPAAIPGDHTRSCFGGTCPKQALKDDGRVLPRGVEVDQLQADFRPTSLF
ncbi:hypothetical protein OF83DRAFT_1174259 [Amylostereum chailletii]|nr:hypothetical protein OF83DRAFT_1174259 [Amylostereum chailletii]